MGKTHWKLDAWKAKLKLPLFHISAAPPSYPPLAICQPSRMRLRQYKRLEQQPCGSNGPSSTSPNGKTLQSHHVTKREVRKIIDSKASVGRGILCCFAGGPKLNTSCFFDEFLVWNSLTFWEEKRYQFHWPKIQELFIHFIWFDLFLEKKQMNHGRLFIISAIFQHLDGWIGLYD